MELLDALSGNTSEHLVVELSLSLLFRRNYSALFIVLLELLETLPSVLSTPKLLG